ncbi:MAG TPA: KUP/HAK/KT family potassium transporter, partial [Sphingomicrobium sp.]|nr:KUP/HAK/KT family potassium transporter [Sphingomicrobium sp.]
MSLKNGAGGRRSSSLLALGALGVVFGDLGTSPLYTLQTVVEAEGGRLKAATAIGVLSLIVWTLIITVCVKYAGLVMRADNRGEGGILALMSMVGGNSLKRRKRLLTLVGLAGAALLYGDGVITPSISVLSALEGLDLAAPALKPYVMPAAILVLAILFVSQKFGSGKIGSAFGPIMLLWFATIAALGIAGIARNPEVGIALNPLYAIRML